MPDAEAPRSGERSQWNAMCDRCLSHPEPLTTEEWRLVTGLMRLSFGWYKPTAKVGRDELCRKAGLHSRSLRRTLDSLVSKGLLEYSPGRRGRGNNVGEYRLLVVDAKETDDLVTAIEAGPGEKAPPRKRAPRKKKAATQRAAASPSIQTRVLEEFRSHGGNLEYGDNRMSLIGQIKRCVKAGHDEDTILAAAAELGRSREFGGFLFEKAEELRETGGPCKWRGYRQNLSPEALRDCGCKPCLETAAYLTEVAAV